MSAAEATMSAADATAAGGKRTFTQKMLDGIERVGNKVPHPVIIFLYLIVLVMDALRHPRVLQRRHHRRGARARRRRRSSRRSTSGAPLAPTGIVIQEQSDDYVIEEQTVFVRSLLTIEGIRFIFTSFVSNFANFSVVATIFVAMIGVGVAEQAGMMAALIRKLVAVTPGQWLTFIIVLVGGLSSVATDAGYLILIPLGAAAFLSVGRHPVAGIAAAYAGVSASFAVNVLIAPLDALLTEMTNEAIAIVDPAQSITITANWYFSTVSLLVMAVVMTFVTARMIEPRLGVYDPREALGHAPGEGDRTCRRPRTRPTSIAEAEGARVARRSVGLPRRRWPSSSLFTLPPGAPLRDPETGDIVGTTPFMDSLIFIITLLFLVAGIGYGRGAGTIKSSVDVINGGHQDLRRAGRAGLHAAGDQPVHRLLQLLAPARRHRRLAGPGAASGPRSTSSSC